MTMQLLAEVKKNSVPLMWQATETAPGVLAIRGPLSKDPATEDETAAYSVIAEWIRAQDPDATIVLDIDSIGGDVAGVESLAALIESRPGPNFALITGTCASAAYWIASACDRIKAVPSALIGSIGTMLAGESTTVDQSSTYSPRKNAEDEQWQEILDAACERFLAHIARRRHFEETDYAAIAHRCGDGKMMTASEALDRGLIDVLTEEGSMPNLDEMPQVEKEEQSVEETIRDLRMVIEDHEKRIAEMELRLQDLRDEREDEEERVDDTTDDTDAGDSSDAPSAEAKCKRPAAQSTRELTAIETRLRAMERAQRDDLVLRLQAEGKIRTKAEADIARNTYDTNRSLFDRVYGRPAAMSTVSRVSSGAGAADTHTQTPAEQAWALVAQSGGTMSYAEAWRKIGGK